MAEGGSWRIGPFSRAIRRWRYVGGGIDRTGRVVTKPVELQEAELVDTLCQRYGCLPSQLLDEDVELLRMLAVIAESNPPETTNA